MTTINSLQSNSTDRFFYRRHLPHYQPSDATFFVTFRLAGSLPVAVIERMRLDREQSKKRIDEINNRKTRTAQWNEFNNEYFIRFDGLIDKNEKCPLWLRDPRIATVVQDAIHHRDKKEYNLVAYCIMPNHVHMVFEINTVNDVGRAGCPTNKADVGRADCSPYRVTQILKNLKWYTALESNKILHRTGPFWQHESYDHVVRDDNDLSRIVDYVLMNPVSAGLVDSFEKWPWTYLKNL